MNWRQHRYVRRGEVRIGSLVGSEGKILCTPDRLVGDPLDTVVTDQAESYHIAAAGDEQGVRPQAVFRKSKPVDCTRAPARETSAMEHTVFLKLADSLATGRRYTIHFRQGLLAEDAVSFDFEPSRLRSEAIHVQQIGFRPDDPGKLAFLSCWMGNGGPIRRGTDRCAPGRLDPVVALEVGRFANPSTNDRCKTKIRSRCGVRKVDSNPGRRRLRVGAERRAYSGSQTPKGLRA